jgi:hypothetical protein
MKYSRAGLDFNDYPGAESLRAVELRCSGYAYRLCGLFVTLVLGLYLGSMFWLS